MIYTNANSKRTPIAPYGAMGVTNEQGMLNFVDGLVIAVIDAVAAFYALDVVDGELLLFFYDCAVGALGFAGTAFDATLGNDICHSTTSAYFTSPLRST